MLRDGNFSNHFLTTRCLLSGGGSRSADTGCCWTPTTNPESVESPRRAGAGPWRWPRGSSRSVYVTARTAAFGSSSHQASGAECRTAHSPVARLQPSTAARSARLAPPMSDPGWPWWPFGGCGHPVGGAGLGGTGRRRAVATIRIAALLQRTNRQEQGAAAFSTGSSLIQPSQSVGAVSRSG